MEKFYKVAEGHELYGIFKKFMEGNAKVAELMNEFMADNGFHSTRYRCCSTDLFIELDEEDKIKFADQLRKDGSFKKNSALSKAWVKKCQDAGAESMPLIPIAYLYFPDIIGQSSQKLYECNGVLYCVISYDHAFKTPDGFIEVKPSVFYSILEQNGMF